MAKDSKILVVEDNVTTRVYIKRILKNLGYQNVLAVDDGKTAALEMKVNDFDLIISDWDMPNLNGLEFLKLLRKNPKRRNTPFLMVTAEKEVAKMRKALHQGADNYIVKPFQPAYLKKKIQELLGEEPEPAPEGGPGEG